MIKKWNFKSSEKKIWRKDNKPNLFYDVTFKK